MRSGSHSLKELARLATSVSERIDKISTESVTELQYHKLGVDLAMLSDWAPYAEGLGAAWATWFRCGLASFEKDFVVAMESRIEGSEKWHQDKPPVPNLLITYDQLRDFLSRKNLGDKFADVFADIEKLIDRLVQATTHIQTANEYWRTIRIDLDQTLRRGKF